MGEYIVETVVPREIPEVLCALGFHLEEKTGRWWWGDEGEIMLENDQPVDFYKSVVEPITKVWQMWGRQEALADIRKLLDVPRRDECQQ
jgi:hypothetical protein